MELEESPVDERMKKLNRADNDFKTKFQIHPTQKCNGSKGGHQELGQIGFTGLESLGTRLDSWRKYWSSLEESNGNIRIYASNHHVIIMLTMIFETAVQ